MTAHPSRKGSFFAMLVQRMLLRQYTPPAVLINPESKILYMNGRPGRYLAPGLGIVLLTFTGPPCPPLMSPSDSSARPGHPPAALLALRARAEQRRLLVTQAPGQHSPEELQRLVQELQLFRVALEMQCEELLLSQAEAQAARLRYEDLYDYAPVGYFTLTPTGLIEQLNFRGAQLLGSGRQRLMRRRFALFVAPAQRLDFGQFLARVLSTDAPQGVELVLQQEDGQAFYGQLEGLRVNTPAGPQCRLALFDATARQQAIARQQATARQQASSEACFRKLFGDTFSAVLLLQGQHYVDCNAAALRLLGTSHRAALVGQLAWAPAPECQPGGAHSADLFAASIRAALLMGSHCFEVLLHRPSGEPVWVEAVLTALEPEAPAPLIHVVWRDITAARLAGQQLRQSKEFTDSLLHNTVDGIMAVDAGGRITAWNAQAARFIGCEPAEVLGQPLTQVLGPLTEATHQLVSRVLAGERIDLLSHYFEPYPRCYDAHLVPLYDHGQAAPSGVLAVVRDVTKRNRLAEEATQQRLRQQQEVLAAILTTQETERKRIAEALHNGLGQLLYATKLSLEGRAGGAGPSPAALRLLDEAIRATRTISFELTPGVLEDFGLRTALRELVKRIAPAGLPVRLHLSGLEQRLAPPVEIGVYRTVQELLNNVMKHAGATEAVVHVAHEGGHLEVSVEDDGCGFEPGRLAAQPLTGIGLAGVRNRVALLGGRLVLHSQLGRGTIASFELVV